ncbi:MAG: alpha-ketoglutarate-dependent dioxygenase AlkB [Cytophagales bacterium]|nr:MAG: alpha-ketoglutarate-dependent dioxygenase AlkB [Cytophagales bacterium]TAF60567.1 MAG: alpha-ketoglutarate-dependent dioxygenase AlkB [Cytophagales bacterium]
MVLFDLPERITFNLPEADVLYYAHFLSVAEANDYFLLLKQELQWQQKHIKLFGKQVLEPRLTAFYGDEHRTYTYSQTLHVPLPWPPVLWSLKQKLEAALQTNFNVVLANYYRNGQDSMGLHADDEPELGSEPCIASLSLGQSRFFRLVHKRKKYSPLKISLEHGSLLVMRGHTQTNWLHELPKSTKNVGERINLTFRHLQTP